MLVKQLLARRAKIRRGQLAEPVNAAADLKKLHDLSPTDQAVMDELAGLLMELGDYKSLVQLYEDQILRGKDMNARAELARKVARIWEEQLGDGREAADAWRRVLRLKAGDAEATGGLERTKANQLKKPEGDPKAAYAPPQLVSDQPVPPPGRPGSPGSVRGSDLATSSSRPAGVRISAPPPVRAEETTSTGNTNVSPTNESRMRSQPPPLPLPSTIAEPAIATKAPGFAATDGPAMTIRGVGKSGPQLPAKDFTQPNDSLDAELDASFDRLELDGPSTTAEPSQPEPTRRPDNLALATPPDEVTESGQMDPRTLRELAPRTNGGAVPPPRVDPGPLTRPGGLDEDDDPASAEDPTGMGMHVDLARTQMSEGEGETDDIVIADDLAESDAEEPTETGRELPPHLRGQ